MVIYGNLWGIDGLSFCPSAQKYDIDGLRIGSVICGVGRDGASICIERYMYIYLYINTRRERERGAHGRDEGLGHGPPGWGSGVALGALGMLWGELGRDLGSPRWLRSMLESQS